MSIIEHAPLYVARPSWCFWLEVPGRLLVLLFLFVFFLACCFVLLCACYVCSGRMEFGMPTLYPLRLITVVIGYYALFSFLWQLIRALYLSGAALNVRYIVNDRSCNIRHLVFSALDRSFSSDKIKMITIEQGIIGRWCGYGTVTWHTEDGKFRWYCVPRFREFCSQILVYLQPKLWDDAGSLVVSDSNAEVGRTSVSRCWLVSVLSCLAGVTALLAYFAATALETLETFAQNGLSSISTVSAIHLLAPLCWFMATACGFVVISFVAWNRIKRTLFTGYMACVNYFSISYRAIKLRESRFARGDLRDIVVKRGILGRILDYGSVVWRLSSPKHKGRSRVICKWPMIASFGNFSKTVLENIQLDKSSD